MRYVIEKIFDSQNRYQAHKAFWQLYERNASIQPFRFRLKSINNGCYLFVATSEFQPKVRDQGFIVNKDRTIFKKDDQIALTVDLCPIKSNTARKSKEINTDTALLISEYLNLIGLRSISTPVTQISSQEIQEKNIRYLPILHLTCICSVSDDVNFNNYYKKGCGKKPSLGYGLIEAKILSPSD